MRTLRLVAFTLSLLLTSPPPVLNPHYARPQLENRHVKTVKTHIMKFVDVKTTKSVGVGAVKAVVGKKGYLREVEDYERWNKIQERQSKVRSRTSHVTDTVWRSKGCLDGS